MCILHYSEIQEEEIIGKIWNNSIIPKKIKQKKRKMPQALHHLLYSKDFIIEIFKDIWDTMILAEGNGYKVLYKIQHLYYTKLKLINYTKEHSKQKSQESIRVLVNYYHSYFTKEE